MEDSLVFHRVSVNLFQLSKKKYRLCNNIISRPFTKRTLKLNIICFKRFRWNSSNKQNNNKTFASNIPIE